MTTKISDRGVVRGGIDELRRGHVTAARAKSRSCDGKVTVAREKLVM